MKKRFKKAAAILLSAAMCLGMVAQAVPGTAASPEGQTEKALDSAREVETETAKKDTAGEPEKETDEAKKDNQEPQTGDKETEPSTGPESYRITLPVMEGIAYKVDETHRSKTLSTAEQEALLYQAGEAVTFTVEGGGDFQVRKADSSVFLDADAVHDGKAEFTMPAFDLALVFKDTGKETEPGGGAATEPATEKAGETETAGGTEKKTEKETEKKTVQEPATEKETAEPAEGKEAEPETEAPEAEKRYLTFRIKGDAYANVYYGISDFGEAMAHKGTRETFSDSFKVDLADVKDGKIWLYAQSTGDCGYSGITLPEGISRKALRSMNGMGGFIFYELDVSGYDGKDGAAEISFSGTVARTARAAARAADAFDTSTRKKLTGLSYTWVGGQPSMYEPKPSTGESAVWGNGTWTVARPALEDVFSLFGVTKPSNARFTSVGTDGKGNVYMRCTGVADQPSHASLGAGDAYVQCVDIDRSDSSVTYTFRLWGANGGRGQTTEGYFQIISEEEDKPVKIRLHKTLRAGSVTDLLGRTRTGDLSNAKFRVYKLNSAGIQKIEAAHNDTGKTAEEWWDAHSGRATKKEILGYIEKLILKDNAKPGDAQTGNLNPNPAYFTVVSSYATGPGGWTERFPVDTGVKDYYIAFERKAPDGVNLGYQGSSGVPEGKHYFYKIFSVYGDDSIIAIDGEGGSENNTEDRAVTFQDDPILTELRLGKKVDIQPEAKGLSWSDFEFFVSDNASFSGKVATIRLTGEETVISNFLVGEKYYLKENPDSPACRSGVGYTPDATVYSFSLQEDGKALFSDTHPGELDAPEAVDAYIHLKIEILNKSTAGPVKLIKASSVPDITMNNKCYSLAGATYEIYQKTSPTAPNSGGTYRGKLVTDETGASNVLTDIPTGYYYAIETEKPKGFKKNEEPVPFVVRSDVPVNEVRAEDEPLADPVQILLQKKDSETGEDTPQAGAALEGAEYTVNYYDGYYDTNEDLDELTPFRSWVFRTDSNGKISLRTSTPISGGSLYYNINDEPVFPLGTISIQETKEPDGYKIDPTVYIYKIEEDTGTNTLKAWNTAEFSEVPERGDFKFPKISDDGTPLAEVPFRITSNTTGESHVILTDDKGILDTSKPHSRNTNRGESPEDGIWFGDMDALDDAKGALLYDTYTVEELLCENNKDKFLIEPFTVTVDSDLAETGVMELDPVENETKEEPKLKTTATDMESMAHDAYVNETTTITDVVEYADLEVGKEYTFDGYLVLKETGEPLLDAEGNKITASTTITVPGTAEDFEPSIEGSGDGRYGRGTVELSFTFDSSLLKGKSVVVFEDLYLEEFHVAAHADISDGGQTVNFKDPQVSTAATDKNTGKHYAPLEEEVTIIDEVAYHNLIPGHAYRLNGILMDKATGEPLLVDGTQVVSEKEFTPGETDGTVTLEYTLDSTSLEDVSTVVFETLSYGEREIAAHADINDENQEVYFTDTKIGTTATDKETGLHDGIVGKATTVTDRVQYTGLIPGREYTVSGYLVLKETGEPLVDASGKKVESSTTFTPAEKDGSVDVVFTFDSSLLAGKTTVAFETIYQGKREVGTHMDINDADQTVTFHKPEIGTAATEKELGGHEAFVSEKTTITDVVHYKNLVPGVTYTVSGVLMDKDSGKPVKADGKQVTSEATFTPEAAEGDVEVAFTLDSGKLAGKTTVVFETLYLGTREVASHTEIGDKKQTVSFKDVQIGTKARDKESGTQEAGADKKVTVIDTVSYSGLAAGKKYTVSGVLMDKATGKPLKVNGEKVTAEKTFKAEKAKGSVELSFTFDASALAGKTLVAFESLSYNGREIASHADLEDKDQTVTVKQEEKKDGGGGSSVSKSPKTGDTTKVLPYIVLALIAAAVILDWSRRRRKKPRGYGMHG